MVDMRMLAGGFLSFVDCVFTVNIVISQSAQGGQGPGQAGSAAQYGAYPGAGSGGNAAAAAAYYGGQPGGGQPQGGAAAYGYQGYGGYGQAPSDGQ